MATFRGGDASDFDFTAVEPEDAVEYFRRKGYQVGFSWQDVWQDEHARAFTVAKAMTLDLLKDIRNVVDEAISDGIAFEDFQAKLEPILRARGWWGRQLMEDPLTGKEREVQLGSARRLGIIYDTNLRMSYSAGSWAQVERTKKDLPYLRYWDPDPNPRPQHLDWSGTVLPADDPWWDTHYPPNGWHCKCLADSLSESDLGRYGYERSATAPPSPTYTYENRRTGEVSQVPVGIDPGFAYNPGKAGIRYAAEKNLTEKLATAEPDIAKAVKGIKPPRDSEASPVRKAVTLSRRANERLGQALRSAWKKTPPRIRTFLEDAGVSVHLSRRRLEDMSLTGTPRGWPAGATFDGPVGLYLPSSRLISVASEVHSALDPTRYEPVSRDVAVDALHHEIGHALFRLRGDNEAFRATHAADVSSGAASVEGLSRYYLQPGDAGFSEVFAGLVADCLGSPEPELRAAFPGCAAVVHSFMRSFK